mgnify:FL=1
MTVRQDIALALLLLLSALSASAQLQVGADRMDEIVHLTEGKSVGLVANQAAVQTDPAHTFLLDALIDSGVEVKRLFSPEHGFRAMADAGAKVDSATDPVSGLPVISLYGKHHKPTAEDFAGLDVVLFDLQDVGVRFFTYISTLYYVMQTCAETGTPIIVLDRPNPHDAVDGPVLKDMKYRSFVGMFPIPAVHGLTMGELGQMINGEGWLGEGLTADLTVVTLLGWRHGDPYSLPVRPSPNLRSDRALLLYPTLCFIEGTCWSEGRGTEQPFEQTGYPDKRMGCHTFTPQSISGAHAPKHEGKVCYGPDLTEYTVEPGINIEILTDIAASSSAAGVSLITRPQFFDLLAGGPTLRQQLESGVSPEAIRAGWQADLHDYISMRARYLLYPDCRYGSSNGERCCSATR